MSWSGIPSGSDHDRPKAAATQACGVAHACPAQIDHDRGGALL
jgi:hypothetical protein